MRAKNEFRLISEAYDIKLLAEKAVDGTLMCSKDCCGSPVMECKCGDDCPHCNCFMIQKAVKDFGLKSPLLEGIVPEDERDEPIRNRKLPAGHYDHMVRLSRGGKWNTHSVQVRKTEPELIQKFIDQGFRIEKPPAEDYERFQNPYDDYVDDDAREQARRDDELMGDIKVDHDSIPKRPDLEKMQMRMVALDKEIEKAQSRKREDNEEFNRLENKRERARDRAREAEDKGDWDEWNRQENERERSRDQLRDIEDNEEPKRGITGLNPRRSPELHSMKSHAIDKIDLNKWREYPAEDVMKAVYRRYGKELPSVDSYDWAITWDKKVRPWLKENEGNL